jgi:cytochrome oxidase Cu insertion factor (SCO1/SenC/PrrC family)
VADRSVDTAPVGGSDDLGDLPVTHVSDAERRAALAAGAPTVPRRAVVWGLVAAVVLTLGGVAGERLISAVGLNPTSTGSTTTTTLVGTGRLPAWSALLSFEPVAAVRVPPVTLTDQRGRAVSLRALRGRVVVVTFFNASCQDVCEVMAAELRRADQVLGARRDRVVFVTINSDPLALASSPPPRAVTATGLASLANWHYLTGPLSTLNRVWNDFGVSISVYKHPTAIVHNDVLYLVDPAGKLIERGSPFSDESHDGSVTLPAGLERLAGDGLASVIAAHLATSR